MSRIRIHSVVDLEGNKKKLDVLRLHYEHKDTEFEEGGYLTLDEFAEWLDN